MPKNKVFREFKGQQLSTFPSDFTVVDIESTGISADTAEILEVSALRFRGDKFEAAFSSLIKPSAPIPYFISELTGITDDMVKDAPERKGVLRSFKDFLQDDVIIGHNVNFDVNFLYDELLRYLGYPMGNDFVDVLRLSRLYLPNLVNHKQVTVAEFFGLNTSGAHRALKDTEICAENYLRIKAMALGGEV